MILGMILQAPFLPYSWFSKKGDVPPSNMSFLSFRCHFPLIHQLRSIFHLEVTCHLVVFSTMIIDRLIFPPIIMESLQSIHQNPPLFYPTSVRWYFMATGKVVTNLMALRCLRRNGIPNLGDGRRNGKKSRKEIGGFNEMVLFLFLLLLLLLLLLLFVTKKQNLLGGVFLFIEVLLGLFLHLEC